MGDPSKVFRGYWAHGNHQVISEGWFAKISHGRFKGLVSLTTFIFFSLVIVIAALLNFMDIPIIQSSPFSRMMISSSRSTKNHEEYPLNCSASGLPQKCSDNYPTKFEPVDLSTETCPDYFRWIYHDLQPWKKSGITKQMIESGKQWAHFRFVIVNGKAYLEKYGGVYQTRDVFTIWGILQLLRLYPGKIPDLDFLFSCGDTTVILKKDYQGPNATSPPPVFHYCGEDNSLDIVFPDWSFWGWAELSIAPWVEKFKAIKKGNQKIKWEDRVPYAYWKGNPYVSYGRIDLMKCNHSDKYDWNVRLYTQDWAKEDKEGFKSSKLEDQCTHRYKIYIEGRAWSVSEKYILACDSMALLIKPDYFDFFSRGLVPMQHYWPIRLKNKCRDFKFAVSWGNNHTDKSINLQAKAIGKAGSKFIEEFVSMKNIYDYMFHVLNEYSKLLKFKPTIPPNAKRVCAETIACSRKGLKKKYMLQSMVKSPSDKLPCALSPFEPQAIQASLEANEEIIRQVETWEAEYWKRLTEKKQ